MKDVLVIGGGPGGYAAAIRSAQLGASVTLIEASDLGGTCVNKGCIPTKIWIQAARLKQTLENVHDWGFQAELKGVDTARILERVKGIPGDIRTGMRALCANNGVQLIFERGVFNNPHEVIAGGKTYTAEAIIIATGCKTSIPEIQGLVPAALSYDEILMGQSFPKSLLIVGAGPIELEMASILNAFGSKVVLITASHRILPNEDAGTSQRIAMSLKEQGVDIRTRTMLSSVFEVDKGYGVATSGKSEGVFEIERVLAMVRQPHLDFGLDIAGVKLNEKGFIQVDDMLRTSARGVYAIGDVVGSSLLSYAATAMGLTAAENAFGQNKSFDSKAVPRGLCTSPEAASVGLTEDEAEDLGYDIEIGDCPMSVNGLAMAHGRVEGAVKVVADAETGQILGVHIVGNGATEMIWGASLAIKLKATAEDLADLLALHPTYAENLVTAGQDTLKRALYLPKR